MFYNSRYSLLNYDFFNNSQISLTYLTFSFVKSKFFNLELFYLRNYEHIEYLSPDLNNFFNENNLLKAAKTN